MASPMHTIVFAKGAWRRKQHGSRATGCFWRGQEASTQLTERATEQQERAIMTKSAHFEAVWGSKTWYFGPKLSEVVFRNCASHASEKHFFKKCEAKSELDRKNHGRCILKLAFLMQSRNKVHGISFLLLARHWLVFFENHKISPLRQMGRPSGMHWGAGGRFEEG